MYSANMLLFMFFLCFHMCARFVLVSCQMVVIVFAVTTSPVFLIIHKLKCQKCENIYHENKDWFCLVSAVALTINTVSISVMTTSCTVSLGGAAYKNTNIHIAFISCDIKK